MEAHDPGAVFSSIDTHGRYARANQPRIAQWNLACLAEALLPLIASAPAQRAPAMRRTSPIYIARNHRVEEALAAASADADLEPFKRLLDVLAQPFDEHPGLETYAAPAPPELTARYRTFCGT